MTAVELLQEVFEAMSPKELQQTADMIIGHASDAELHAEHSRRQEPRNDYENYPGVVTYRN
jgi:hypothetical protein